MSEYFDLTPFSRLIYVVSQRPVHLPSVSEFTKSNLLPDIFLTKASWEEQLNQNVYYQTSRITFATSEGSRIRGPPLYRLRVIFLPIFVFCSFQNIYSISGPNIALGMKANQGPDTYQSCSADKAVDGDTSNTAGNYAHTTLGFPAWWRVDLGKRFSVTGLKLFNRARGRTYLCNCIYIIHLVHVVCVFLSTKLMLFSQIIYVRRTLSNFLQFYGALTCLSSGRNNRMIKSFSHFVLCP